MVHFTILACAAVMIMQLQSAVSLTADSISQCPRLPPRQTSPTSVRDLRPDDIKVVMAIGDSITAGFGAKGLANGTILNINNLNEDRGISYAAGGDPGAITLPNMFGNYVSNVGASVGEHPAEICFGILCSDYQYHPEQDKLNSAQTGALASNLEHELEYLIPQIQSLPEIDFTNDWKFLNLQIGSNDLCLSCSDPFGLLTANAYESYVRGVLEKIRTSIPKVIVNLVSTFKVSQVYTVTMNQSYCQLIPGLPHLNMECGCALLGGDIGVATRAAMDQHTEDYNARLLGIRDDYAAANHTDFGIIYQPANLDIAGMPIGFFSNIDCFHPSQLAHTFVAKKLWNGLFTPLSTKGGIVAFDMNLPVYCPTETDRLMLD